MKYFILAGIGVLLVATVLLLIRGPQVAQMKALTVCPSGCEYSSIQEAIDAAQPENTVEIKAGTYRENIEIKKSLTIRGVSQEKVIIDGDKRGYSVVRIMTPGEQAILVRLEGLQIIGAEGGNGMLLQGSAQAKIRGCTISRNTGDGIRLEDSAQIEISKCTISENDYGIWLWNSARVEITDCIITLNDTGIVVLGSALGKITDSRITRNLLNGVELRGNAQATVNNSIISENIINGILLRNSA